MKVKHLNRVANQVSCQTKCRRKPHKVSVLIRHLYLPIFFIFKDIYTIMVGCGIENVNLLVSALKRHTRHVQVIVFERDDMVSGPMVVVINSRSFCQMFHCLFFFRTKTQARMSYAKLRRCSYLHISFLVSTL